MIRWLARCGRHSRPWAITAHETVGDVAAIAALAALVFILALAL
jgi:hypothetical protein